MYQQSMARKNRRVNFEDGKEWKEKNSNDVEVYIATENMETEAREANRLME